jgi:hypothetical protein
MPDTPLEERLAAVERALSDADPEATPPDVDGLPARVAAIEEDVAELEAAVQAVRGYVGGVRAVNEDVEQRADAAMATAQAVERALAAEGGPAHSRGPAGRAPTEYAQADRTSTEYAQADQATTDQATTTRADHPGDAGPAGPDTAVAPCPHCGSDAGAGWSDGEGTDGDHRAPDHRDDGPNDPPAGDGGGPRGVGQRHVGEDDAGGATGLLDRVREVL